MFPFWLTKLYYKYVDTSAVNHYRLLLLTEEYQQLEKQNANVNVNVNKYKQNQIVKTFFANREIICKNKKNEKKEYSLCSEYFQHFYAERIHHYANDPEYIKCILMEDIMYKK